MGIAGLYIFIRIIFDRNLEKKAMKFMPLITLFLLMCAIMNISPVYATDITEDITGVETWTSQGNPYVVKNTIEIKDDGILTIEEGVEVRIVSGCSLKVMDGTLVANGSPGLPILFTSDSTANWAYIYFNLNCKEGCCLNECIIENGGSAGSSSGSIYFHYNENIVSISNTIIRNGNNRGIYIYHGNVNVSGGSIENIEQESVYIYGDSEVDIDGVDISEDVVNPGVYGLYFDTLNANTGYAKGKIVNCTVDNGIYFSYGTSASSDIDLILDNNTFTNYKDYPTKIPVNLVGQFLQNNDISGQDPGLSEIEIIGGTINDSATWPDLYLIHIILSSCTLAGSNIPTLIINPGVELRFNSNSIFKVGLTEVQPGILKAQGDELSKIKFTSNDTAKDPGYWNCIHLNYTTSETIIEFCEIECAQNNIKIQSSNPIIRNNDITKASVAGIEVFNGGPIIEGNNVTDNKCGIHIDDVGIGSFNYPVIRNNNIHNNDDYGIVNDQSSAILATLNWWGSADDPSGVSDAFNGNVLYEPWLAEYADSDLNWLYAKSSPDPFTQNNGQSQFVATLSEAADWIITIKNDLGNPVKTINGSGNEITEIWEGDDNNFNPLVNGEYTYIFDANISGGSSAPSATGTVTLDDTLPIAIITAPGQNEMISSGLIDIIGTANGDNFVDYDIDYGVGFPYEHTTWIDICSGSTSIVNDTFSTWTPTGLDKPIYTIKLTVLANSLTAEDYVNIRYQDVLSFQSTEQFISPNEDGIKDSTLFQGELNWPVDWSIEISQGGGNPVRTINGTGTPISIGWYGKNDQGTVVVDGEYDCKLIAIDSESGVQVVSDTLVVTVDNTIPIADIESPPDETTFTTDDTIEITGTASDLNIEEYKVWIDDPSKVLFTGEDSITSNSLGQFDPSPYGLGPHIITLDVTDEAGNKSNDSIEITLDALRITEVKVQSDTGEYLDTIDPWYGSDDANIVFNLSHDADVTCKVIQYGQSGATWTKSNVSMNAGPNTIIWDGSKISLIMMGMMMGGPMQPNPKAPESLYIVNLIADDGVRHDEYYPEMGEDPWTGGGSVVEWEEEEFIPFQNNCITLKYLLDHPAKINAININVKVENPATDIIIRTLVSDIYKGKRPFSSDQYIVKWDGRFDNGKIFNGFFGFDTFDFSAVPENPIIIEYDDCFDYTDVRVEPYLIFPGKGQVATIYYHLKHKAKVSIDVIDSNGNDVVSLLTLALREANNPSEEYDEIWDGRNDDGKIVAAEGDYTIVFEAKDVKTNKTVTRKLVVVVYH